ncbi:hypothetical protein [Leptonema illini]|uniref:DUF3805 domain-containing protein n=1 Tax=Leptonema illini DSM 21528 TaxID=929563 RepID=H2CFC5_9LEPT|nr:hypothetical protein [Leptonema illini]EHQ06753.1 hypothetical protein Lepil_2072 [Leptonema illini DSM 21528]
MKRFRGTFFDLEYSDTWEMEIIENVPCFFDPDGIGALQAAAFREPEGTPFNPIEQLGAYLERHGLTLDTDRVAVFDLPSGLQAAACEFMKDDRFWLVNCIVKGDKMLLMLWNSDALPDADTAEAIGRTVMTIRFYD